MIGDQLYLKGLKKNNLDLITKASQIFPFDRDLLVGPAQYYFKNRLIDNNAIHIYKDALKYDPYSVQFLGVYGQLEFLYGNKNKALIVKNTLDKIAPNSNAYKRIIYLTQGLK